MAAKLSVSGGSVVFRPCLPAGLALSYLNILLYLIIREEIVLSQADIVALTGNKWQKVRLKMLFTPLNRRFAHFNFTLLLYLASHDFVIDLTLPVVMSQ